MVSRAVVYVFSVYKRLYVSILRVLRPDALIIQASEEA